ncbi:hypothetical protein BVI2075_180151 [Burkholderia vietnamiensis]|nr:hypothetical protein BVI2075_180151 [Burkholderia vietnamiensis]
MTHASSHRLRRRSRHRAPAERSASRVHASRRREALRSPLFGLRDALDVPAAATDRRRVQPARRDHLRDATGAPGRHAVSHRRSVPQSVRGARRLVQDGDDASRRPRTRDGFSDRRGNARHGGRRPWTPLL